MLLDCCGDDAFDADTVTSHDDRHRLTFNRQHGRAHRLRILCAEFEDVTNLHCLENFQCAFVTTRTTLAGNNSAQVGPTIWLDIAFNLNPAQVMVVFIGAGRHVGPVLETKVRDNQELKVSFLRAGFCSDATEAPGAGAEQLANLFRLCGTHRGCR